MKNISLSDIINYSEMVGSIKKNIGVGIERPFLTSVSNLNKSSGYLDRWRAYLSEDIRTGKRKGLEDILLRLERTEHLTAEEFELLDEIAGQYIKGA